MGGRGASRGISDKGHKYGTDYKTILKSGNIKFVRKTSNNSEQLLETRTSNRVYVTVNDKNNISNIIYMGKDLMKTKKIDVGHSHKGMKPHTHHGSIHNENDSSKGAANLTTKEKAMVDRVKKIWYNNNSR